MFAEGNFTKKVLTNLVYNIVFKEYIFKIILIYPRGLFLHFEYSQLKSCVHPFKVHSIEDNAVWYGMRHIINL